MSGTLLLKIIQKNTGTAIVIGALLLSVGIFLFDSYQTTRLRKKKAVEDAISHFSTDSATRQIGFDSVYAANDTISYYKLGTLTGRSVITYE